MRSVGRDAYRVARAYLECPLTERHATATGGQVVGILGAGMAVQHRRLIRQHGGFGQALPCNSVPDAVHRRMHQLADLRAVPRDLGRRGGEAGFHVNAMRGACNPFRVTV